MGLLITLALGLFVGLGAWISCMTRNNKIIVQISVALAFGTLTALAVLELFPEAMESLGTKDWWMLPVGVAVGVALLKLLDHFIPDHDEHYSQHGHEHAFTEKNVTHIGIISSVAVTLHNIIEGMAVYSISGQSLTNGMLVALGVGLHNIPMGMIIYSTLQKGKRSRKTEMILLASLSTFVGGILMSLLWGLISDVTIGVLVSITLGMIVYIVFFELIPMLIHTKNWHVSISAIVAGVGLIIVSTRLG